MVWNKNVLAAAAFKTWRALSSSEVAGEAARFGCRTADTSDVFMFEKVLITVWRGLTWSSGAAAAFPMQKN